MGGMSTSNRKAVGDELLAVLPQDERAWYTKGHLLKLNFCLVSLVLFSSANGYDGSLMNGLQALHQWSAFMEHPAGAWLGFINAIYWLGCGINFPIAAWVANTWGRKRGVYIGYLCLILGVCLSASSHVVGFVLSRFFVGCASAWFGNAVPLLMNEIAYPTHRGIVNALFNCGWYVGGIVAAFITYGTRNMDSNWAWRIPTICQVLIPILALPGFLLVPESPRWLASKDRTEQARTILERSHAGGDSNSALVNYEMIEIVETLRAEKASHSNSSYADMVKTPGNRRRLYISISLGFFSQWSGNGVVSYYLALVLETVGITSVKDQTLISGCLQIWNLLFAVGAAFSVDRLGRRPLFMASAATMLVGFITVTGLSGSFANSGNAATGTAVIPFLFIFFAGYDIALTPFLSAYPCEIWPYQLRSRGLTVTYISVVIGIFFNTFINPIALGSIGWKYYFVFVAVLVCFGLTAYFFYPETRGYTLEQIAVIFDGENADVPAPAETAYRSKSIVSEKGMVAHEEAV
ncbi:hypothetical protein LTR85_009197 [Meristemomyces frigidus]|nr:hypothetical protein LTR85_009197 [Meristemomyces frigidus]